MAKYPTDSFSKSSILFTFIGEEILNTQFLVIFFLILLTFFFWRKDSQLKQFLPVPWNIPVVGSLPWVVYSLVRQHLPVYEFMRRLRYSYGSVYAFNMCGTVLVILNDYNAIKKAMESPHVSDRPSMKGAVAIGHKGLVLGSGQTWSQQRKFTQATFRSFGVGTKSFEDKIVLESHALINKLTKHINSTVAAFDLEHVIANAVSNIICAVVFGQRFDYADKKFTYFQHLAMQQTELGRNTLPQLFLPILRYIPSKNRRAMLQNRAELLDFIGEIISEHEKDFDSNHLRDYIDVYLNELQKDGELSNFAKLDQSNMLHTISQLFTAGTDTTTQTLRWGLTFLVACPHIQRRVQREIDDVVGRDRLPTLSDKPFMPYTCATIFEIQRMSHTRLSVPHKCSKAISVSGVTIPKEAIVVANVFAVHRDPELWTDPNVFNPDRFINAKGEVYQHEELIPFNTGRRKCLGDKLARMELFIFLSHLLHQFSFEAPSSSEKYPDPGIGNSPANPCIRLVKRD